MNNLPFDLTKYINLLLNKCKNIDSIWLIGSRANETYRNDSDWDLLLFSSVDLRKKIKETKELHLEFVDLMVVYDGNNFEKPWGNKMKGGSLSGWEWKKIDKNNAVYKATKIKEIDKNKESFEFWYTKGVAKMLWSKCHI